MTLAPITPRRRVGAGRTQLVIALGLSAFIAGLALAPRAYDPLSLSKAYSKAGPDQELVRAYASEAFPAWSRLTSRVCPSSIAQLNAFIGRRTDADSWGIRLALYCTDAPDGRHAVIVRSAGEDRKFGTSDDIWSDR